MAHSGSLPPSSGDIGNPISQQLVNTSLRLSSFITHPVSVSKHTEHGRPQVKRSKIRTRTSSGYPVSGASVTPGSGAIFPPNIQALGDNSMCVPNILPVSTVVQRSVLVHWITQLGLRSHPNGTTIHEAPTTTLLFARSDRPVCSPGVNQTLKSDPPGFCDQTFKILLQFLLNSSAAFVKFCGNIFQPKHPKYTQILT